MNEVVLSTRRDLYREVTEKIVAAMEGGAGQFMMPWHGGIVPPLLPTNAATGKPYRGVNVVTLWAEATIKRYISGHWASYRQWQELGAQVRKGQRGTLIVFYKKLDPEPGLLEGEENASPPRFVARPWHVFNAEQVDGWQPPIPEIQSRVEIDEQVAAFVAATGAEVRHGAHAACFRRDLDRIDMPSPELFIGTGTSSPTEAYHAVLLHELVHYSGGPGRLEREFGKRFGDRAYAFEELIAELGAAFLCSAFRIVNEPRPDHAKYLSSWLAILDDDKKAVFTAASKAQEAVEYLTALAASARTH